MENALIQVLVVIDDSSDALMLQGVLARDTTGSFRVTTAASLDEALSRIGTEAFDVILLDAALPERAGAESLRRVREVNSTIPVIVLVAPSQEGAGVELMNAGAQDYLVKGEQGWGAAARVMRYAAERKRLEEKLLQGGAERKQAEIELEQQADRMNVLAEASRAFASAGTDSQALFEQIARFSSKYLGASSVIRIVSEDGQWLDTVLIYDPRPEAQKLAQSLYGGVRIQMSEQNAVTQVVRSGEPVITSTTDLAPMRVTTAATPEMLEAFQQIRPVSGVIAPFRGQGQVIGCLSLVRNNPAQSPFTEADLTLAQDLADRAALAILNGRLFQQVEQELHKLTSANAQLQFQAHLLENINDAVIATDNEFHIKIWNHAAEAMYGWTADEVLGRHVTEVLQTELQGDQLAEALRGLREQGSRRTEVIQHHQDGHLVYVEGSTIVLKDADGVVTGYVSVNRDIDERKKEEATRLQLAAIVESSDDAIFSKTLDGVLLSWNRGAEQLYGYNADEVIGRSVSLLIPPGQPDELPDILERLRRGERIRHYETTRVRKDGTPVGVSLTLSPIRDQTGQIVGASTIAHDISERLRAEEATARLVATIESSDDAIIGQTMGGVISIWNPAAQNMYGYSAQEAIGRPVEMLVPPELSEEYKQLIERARAGEHQGHFETVRVRKDGQRIHISGIWFLIKDSKGNPVGISAIQRDITERKRMEETLTRFSPTAQVGRFSSPAAELFIALLIGLAAFAVGAYFNFFDFLSQFLITFSTQTNSPFDEIFSGLFASLVTLGFFSFRHARQATSEIKERVALQHALRSLHGELEQRVHERTLDLAKTNESLRAEIEERTRVQAALKREKERAQQYLDIAGVIFLVLGADQGVILINKKGSEILGYGEAEIIGKQWSEHFLPQAERARASAAFDQLMRGEIKPVEYFENSVLTKSAEERLVAWHNTVFTDEAGNILGVVSSGEDITERKRAADEIQQRLAELETINKISTALRTSQTLDEMLPRLLDETMAILDSSAGSIWLYDPASNEVRMMYERGWGFTLAPSLRGEGVPGYVVASGKAYVSADFSTDPRVHPANRESVPPGRGGACIPMRAGNEVIGAIMLDTELPRVFNDADVRLLTTLAEMAGNAIHRTRLFEQTERRARQLASLHTIDMAISSTIDMRVALDILLDQVTSQLNVDTAAVLLFKPQSVTLEYAAGRGFRTKGIEHSRLRLGEGNAGMAALERRVFGVADIGDAAPKSRGSLLAGEGFAAHYAAPLIAKGSLKGVLEIFHRAPLSPDPEWLNFFGTLAGQAAIAVESAQLFEELQHSNLQMFLAYDATIEGWSRALDLRDNETEGHSQRVTAKTLQLARAAGINEEELVHVRRGALLHDIGKMGIPDGILLKPGALTDEEWVIMRKHPTYAYDLLSPIPYLRPALDIPHYHHEKWDGTGYPSGLKGSEIPLAARLFAVVDVWDALGSDRPYRKAWARERVLEHIRGLAGTHFDPRAVELFLAMQEN